MPRMLLLAAALTIAVPAAAAGLPHTLVANAGFTTVAGKHATLADYRHHKLMIWEVATWCGSCVAGLKTMAKHVSALHAAGVTVLLLRIYKNGGYPGTSMKRLVSRYAPSLLTAPGWVIGSADKRFGRTYNPRHYADIYYLINADGQVAAIASAPAATFDKIQTFMTGSDSAR